MKSQPTEPQPVQLQPVDPLDLFVKLSALLTGFNRVELFGTGMVQPYYQLLLQIAGERGVGELLTEGERVLALSGKAQQKRIEKHLMTDPTTGPLAKNLITLWYLGLWNQLPLAWRNVHGAHANDVTHYPSAESYAQGLVWQAMHVHPQGTHQPGFGSWSLKPVTGAPHG